MHLKSVPHSNEMITDVKIGFAQGASVSDQLSTLYQLSMISLSYSTVGLGFLAQKFHLQTSLILILWLHGSIGYRQSQAQKLTLNDWLTSDRRNSITTKAMGSLSLSSCGL